MTDPDRYDPSRDSAPEGPLDPELDPDRYSGRTLPELLGPNPGDSDRVGLEWLYGLLAVLGFLVLVSLAVQLL